MLPSFKALFFGLLMLNCRRKEREGTLASSKYTEGGGIFSLHALLKRQSILLSLEVDRF